MKSIKYIFSAILLLEASYVSAQTQNKCTNPIYLNGTTYQICVDYTPITTYTPNNNPVTVDQWVNIDWTSKQKDEMKDGFMSLYNGIIFEAEATVKYNCHAWAWAGAGVAGNMFWMNSPEAQKYFSLNDQSYVIATNINLATKVWYVSDDHSANTTSTPGYLSSKWGPGPRFKHPINASPFLTSKLTYYQGMSSITGSDLVCTGGSSFTAGNLPARSYTWAWSSNLTAGATSGNSRTFYAANANTSGEGWVAMNVDGAEYVKKPVWAGKAQFTGTLSSNSGWSCPVGTTTTWTVTGYAGGNTPYVIWEAYDLFGTPAVTITDLGNGKANIIFNQIGQYVIRAYPVNTCGTGNPLSFYDFVAN